MTTREKEAFAALKLAAKEFRKTGSLEARLTLNLRQAEYIAALPGMTEAQWREMARSRNRLSSAAAKTFLCPPKLEVPVPPVPMYQLQMAGIDLEAICLQAVRAEYEKWLASQEESNDP